MDTKKVTITATDNIGRTESISLIIPVTLAEKLFKAANNTYPDGSPCSELREEISNVLDGFYKGVYTGLSQHQYRKINRYFDLIYHKFYNYSLAIK